MTVVNAGSNLWLNPFAADKYEQSEEDGKKKIQESRLLRESDSLTQGRRSRDFCTKQGGCRSFIRLQAQAQRRRCLPVDTPRIH